MSRYYQGKALTPKKRGPNWADWFQRAILIAALLAAGIAEAP